MFECVVNISEGRRVDVLDALTSAAGSSLRDRHSDPEHHRSVYTLIHDDAQLVGDVRRLITRAFELLDLRDHHGVHPRFGVVDVVPFVALEPNERPRAVAMRNEIANWIGNDCGVPVFLYGALEGVTTRSLPDVRRHAFGTLAPDVGPPEPDPRRGACAVGERGVLVAWNMWLEGVRFADATAIASLLRAPTIRTMAFRVGDYVQISCNLIEPTSVRPSQIYDRVRSLLVEGDIARCELVGLAPEILVHNEDPSRRSSLDLDLERTIEARTRT